MVVVLVAPLRYLRHLLRLLRLRQTGVGVTGDTPSPLDVLREICEALTESLQHPDHVSDEVRKERNRRAIALIQASPVALAQVEALAEAAQAVCNTSLPDSRLMAALVPFAAHKDTRFDT